MKDFLLYYRVKQTVASFINTNPMATALVRAESYEKACEKLRAYWKTENKVTWEELEIWNATLE